MAASVFRSAVFRLTLLTVALLGIAAAGIVASIGYAASRDQTARTAAAIRSDVLTLRRALEGGGVTLLEAAVREHSSAGAGLYFLSDGAGRRRAGNLAQMPAGFEIAHASGTFTYQPAADAAPRTAVGLTVEIEGGAALVIARDIEQQKQLLATLAQGLAWGLGILALLGLIAGGLLARHIQARIDAISTASRVIMAGDLSGRIPLQGTDDELDRLAEQLNAMLERIERLLTGMREVSDNIAHDLKTPLNRLRNRAETALANGQSQGSAAWREGLEATIEQADELIKTFNALLLIARLEAGAMVEATEIIDAADIAADVADLYAPAGEDAGFVIAVTAREPAPIRANGQLIAQALANLIDNAIKYSDSHASIGRNGAGNRISVSVVREGRDVLLAVADRGPGIAAADREQALRRFGRLEVSRTKPGTGLGLSLVAAVARMHGGTVRLEDNAPGLRVTLVLPAADPAAKLNFGAAATTMLGPPAVEAKP
ncbi:MAG: ATP-binding protein [Hyphomicrobiaceae bacterium]